MNIKKILVSLFLLVLVTSPVVCMHLANELKYSFIDYNIMDNKQSSITMLLALQAKKDAAEREFQPNQDDFTPKQIHTHKFFEHVTEEVQMIRDEFNKNFNYDKVDATVSPEHKSILKTSPNYQKRKNKVNKQKRAHVM